MGILFIFLSVCTNLLEGVLVKKNGEKNGNNVFWFNGFMALASMLFFVITKNGSFNFSKELWLYAVPSAVCYCGALVCTYFALADGPFAISMMIISYSIVLPIIYGIVFLNEPTSVIIYIALAIMAASLYLSRGNTANDSGKFSVKWLICITLATVGSGGFAIVKKMQQLAFNEKCDNEFMIFSLAITVVVLFALGLFATKNSIKSITKSTVLFSLAAGLSNGVTNMLTLLINTVMVLSLSSPISTGMRIVLSFMLSSLFLKEKFLKRQIIGAALGAASLIMLSI
ncbi:MAG: hypothetical protein IJD00_02175 [Clostridia bacterium]|nr:hypothetical protein [Clostridia bacterium]